MNNNEDSNFIQRFQDIAITILVLVAGAYAFLYVGAKFEIKAIADGGALGDFFGGILNPTFALLGLLALLQTIRIQTKELKTSSKALENSHEELKLTREEAGLSREALQQQSESIRLQNFENTFFKMLDLHNDIVKSLIHSGMCYSISKSAKINFINVSDNGNTTSGKVLDSMLLGVKYILFTNNRIPGSETKTNRNIVDLEYHHNTQIERTNKSYLTLFKVYEQSTSKYFRNLYQILKFISRSDIDNKKLYSNVLRAQLSNNELELLFYHCASDIGSKDFMPLLIEFEFLEHLVCDDYINRFDVHFYAEKTIELNNEDPEMNYKDYRVFGKNKEWQKVVENLI